MSLGMPPEWAEVEAKAKQVEGLRPEAIQSAAKTFRDTATKAANHPAELQAAVSGLSDGSWEGDGATAFLGYVDKVGKAGTQLHDRLMSAADGLDRLGQDLWDLRTSIGERVYQAKSAIEQTNAAAEAAAARVPGRQAAMHRQVLGAVPAQSPETIYAEAAKQNSATAKGAAGDLDAMLGKAGTLLDEVSAQMTPEVGGGYSQLPPHGSMPAIPGGGTTTPAAAPSGPATTPAPAHRSAGGGTAHSTTKASAPASHGNSAGGGGGAGGGSGRPATEASGPAGSAPGPAVSGDVDSWVKEAIKILQASGVPVTDADIAAIEKIIQHESGGNPHAVNNWDSNARAGHPSKGLMQCIDSTFRAYKLAGHDDIFNPVDNIIAGVRYIFGRYGGLHHTPGLVAMSHGHGYQGY